jgi:hypothetical protein
MKVTITTNRYLCLIDKDEQVAFITDAAVAARVNEISRELTDIFDRHTRQIDATPMTDYNTFG